MRNRVLTLKQELERIMLDCDVCYVGMIDHQREPYVLPMNFGYKDDHIYFHSARQGKKIDVLKNNNKVCVAFSTDHSLHWVNEEVACSWSMKYKSVLVYGKVEFIEDYDAKVAALNVIMSNYSDRNFNYNAPAVNDVQTWKVKTEKIEGRAYGY
ncbi:MAG: pyridoxamine 5'-phosphate oxidase family protein [Bacteroidales bacterium]